MNKLLNNNGKYGYLAKNTILFAISSFGSKVLTFLLVPLYTNILSTSDYGVADLVITTTNLLVYIFTLEISSAVLRFAIERQSKQGEVLTFGLKVVSIGCLVLLLILLPIRFLDIFQLPEYFYLFLFLYFVGNSFYTVLSSFLRAIDDIIGCAIAGIVLTIIMLSGNIISLVVLKMGIIGYLLSLILAPFVGIAYMIFRVYKSKTFSIKDQCDQRTRKAMLGYSIPLIFNGIGWWINNSLDKYFVIGMIGAAANGVYAAALKIPTILSVFQSVFTQAWNLSAIKEFDKEDKNGFFTNTYNVYNAFLVVITSILILLNIPMARILFAKDFFVAWRCSSILLMSSLFSALSGYLGSIFTAIKNSKIFAYSTIIAAIVNILFNYLLILWIGIEGAAIATAVSFFIMWIIRLICVKRIIALRIHIYRDIVVYLLLASQIIFDHNDGHAYIIQATILIIILLLYFKETQTIIKKLISVFSKQRNAQ